MDNGKEIVRVVSKTCPRFSKVQLCMVRNKEYGVYFSPEAEAALVSAGEKIKTKYTKTLPQKKTPPQTPQKKRVSFRLSDAEYNQLKKAIKESGFRTTQEFMEHLFC